MYPFTYASSFNNVPLILHTVYLTITLNNLHKGRFFDLYMLVYFGLPSSSSLYDFTSLCSLSLAHVIIISGFVQETFLIIFTS